MASVARRLISSGMFRSPLRRPASTWMSGRCSFLALTAAASVELTSPTTSTPWAGCCCSSASMATMTRAVTSAWLRPAPSRRTSGSGMPSSSKNTRFMVGSLCWPVSTSRWRTLSVRFRKARISGAIFMKLGRAPATSVMVVGVMDGGEREVSVRCRRCPARQGGQPCLCTVYCRRAVPWGRTAPCQRAVTCWHAASGSRLAVLWPATIPVPCRHMDSGLPRGQMRSWPRASGPWPGAGHAGRGCWPGAVPTAGGAAACPDSAAGPAGGASAWGSR